MSGPDAPAIPTGGQRTRTTIANDEPSPKTLAPPYLPEPDATEIADTVTPPVLGGSLYAYLTPDAMMIYCQSRLTGIDTQCREIMSKQDKNAKAQGALGELLSALTLRQDGYENPDFQRELETAYNRAINGVGPETELGQKLSADRDKWLRAAGDNKVLKQEMDALISATKSHQSELNSDAEIDMIRLQSLMSQRQTAIQLTTNIIQSLNDQANKIVANIGH